MRMKESLVATKSLTLHSRFFLGIVKRIIWQYIMDNHFKCIKLDFNFIFIANKHFFQARY